MERYTRLVFLLVGVGDGDAEIVAMWYSRLVFLLGGDGDRDGEVSNRSTLG